MINKQAELVCLQMPAAPSVEEITSPTEILQIVAVVAALIAENDHATCLAFVNGMACQVMPLPMRRPLQHMSSCERASLAPYFVFCKIQHCMTQQLMSEGTRAGLSVQ